MRIKKITVKNLFGMFCHEVPLNMEDHITIIHGPNGIGKTILLTLLDALFSAQEGYYRLRRIPFSELSVDFDDESTLRLKKEIKLDVDERDEGGDGSKLVFEFSKHGSTTMFYRVNLARLQEEIVDFSAREKYTQTFLQTNLSGKTLIKFNDKLSQGMESEPEWLKEIQKSGNYSPPTAKFIINEIIFPIVMVTNKIFRLIDGDYNVHTHSR